MTPLYIPYQVPFPEGLDLSTSERSQSRLCTRMLLGGALWESVPQFDSHMCPEVLSRVGYGAGHVRVALTFVIWAHGSPERWQPVCQVPVSLVTGQLYSLSQYMGVASSLPYHHEAAVFLLIPGPHGLHQS